MTSFGLFGLSRRNGHTKPSAWLCAALATWRRRSPAFLRPTRSQSTQGKKRSSGAVTGKGGLFLNALARNQMLPVRAVEGSVQAAMNGAERATSFQSCRRCWSFL